jgi:uncharacterized integral membrane protein
MTMFAKLNERARVSKTRPGAARKGRSRGLGIWWTFAGALVVLGAVIVAVAQNSRHVRLHYLAWTTSVSLIVVVLTTALAAVLIDEAGGLIRRRRRRAKNGNRSELEQLRSSHEQQREAANEPASTLDLSDLTVHTERH